jgi:hypothetical protein
MEVSGRLYDPLEHLDRRRNLSLSGIETRLRGFPAYNLVNIVAISRIKKHGVYVCSNFGANLREQCFMQTLAGVGTSLIEMGRRRTGRGGAR